MNNDKTRIFDSSISGSSSNNTEQKDAVTGQNTVASNGSDPDEINLLEYLYALLKHKWLIIFITLLGFIGGHFSANYIGPVYVGDTVISPKENESSSTPNLSGLGMFGNIVASQLSVGGNASLAKIELLLDSRSFNAELVEKKDLLPLIYSDMWDTSTGKWQDDFTVPPFVSVGGYIKGQFLKKEINSNQTMTITIETKDSLLSQTLLTSYLGFLDDYIRKQVQEDAKENRDYLERQLITITDPLLQVKIQDLISKEVEKMMVVSKEAFKVIDPVLVYKSFKEKRLYPMVFAFGGFIIITLLIIFGHAFSSGQKTEDDKALIKKIQREMTRIPFVKQHG